MRWPRWCCLQFCLPEAPRPAFRPPHRRIPRFGRSRITMSDHDLSTIGPNGVIRKLLSSPFLGLSSLDT